MKTVNDVVEYLEKELNEATKQWQENLNVNREEAMKYRVRANTLENILDDIGNVSECNAEEEHIAMVLIEEPNKKPLETTREKWLRWYINIFFVVTFFSSGICIGNLLSDFCNNVPVLRSMDSVVFYVYFLIHIASYIYMVLNGKDFLIKNR